jgi:hypothetical protein
MNDNDLNSLWICNICKFDFIFKSDVESHIADTGHDLIQKYDLLSTPLIDY